MNLKNYTSDVSAQKSINKIESCLVQAGATKIEPKEILFTKKQVERIVWEARNVYSQHPDVAFRILRGKIKDWFDENIDRLAVETKDWEETLKILRGK